MHSCTDSFQPQGQVLKNMKWDTSTLGKKSAMAITAVTGLVVTILVNPQSSFEETGESKGEVVSRALLHAQETK